MAQASSAQREPSMEEILSSIRKIIEDGDTAEPATSETASSEPLALADGPRNTAAETSAKPVEHEPVADVEPAAIPEPANTSAVERAPVQKTSLDEIRAQIASEKSDDEPVAAVSQPETDAAATEVADESDDDDGFEIFADEELEAPEAIAAPDEKSVDKEWEEEFASVVEGLKGASDASDDLPADSANNTEIASMPEPVAAISTAAAGPILSRETERQVAASFEELSKAFISSRAESYDKMAEELMRPMLQEWLDNNLPTLVEKLVREEIERVARGGASS